MRQLASFRDGYDYSLVRRAVIVTRSAVVASVWVVWLRAQSRVPPEHS